VSSDCCSLNRTWDRMISISTCCVSERGAKRLAPSFGPERETSRKRASLSNLSGLLYQLSYFPPPVFGEAWSENSHVFITSQVVLTSRTKLSLSLSLSATIASPPLACVFLRSSSDEVFLTKKSILPFKE